MVQEQPQAEKDTEKGNAEKKSRKPSRFLRTIYIIFGMTILAAFLVAIYVATAPEIEVSKIRQLVFDSRVAIRRLPSSDSRPIAYTNPGVKRVVLEMNDDWTKIRLDNAITGWVRTDSGELKMPQPKVSIRQWAKIRAKVLIDRIFRRE